MAEPAPSAAAGSPVPGAPPGPWGPDAFLGRHGWWFALLLPVAIAAWLRPLIPPDETRYLNVAWEMWSHGSFVVPLLNGGPYSDKPPLLFWIIHAGWLVTGVSEWWPRLIPAVETVVNTYLLGALAQLLWPQLAHMRVFTRWVAAGTLAWMCFASLLLFDMLLVTCTLVALIALQQATRTGRWRWHGVYALCVGAGILSKGPVILLHVLPVALMAPWWQGAGGPPRGRWYGRTALAVLGGIALALLWVVPAVIKGGPTYANQILWHQSAGRVADSFAHRRSWSFYLYAFPILGLPWILWPRAWRGLPAAWRLAPDSGRFILSGLVPAFVIFTLISGKQLHYMLPWMPGLLVLVAAGAAAADRVAGTRVNLILPAGFWLASALAVGVLLRIMTKRAGLPAGTFTLAIAVAMLTAGTVAGLWQGELLRATRHVVCAAGIVAGLVAFAAFDGIVGELYDVRPAAAIIRDAVAQGRTLASTGAYNGEFGFYARLVRPVPVIGSADAMVTWCAAHPDGLVIDRSRPANPPYPGAVPAYSERFKGGELRLWSCSPAPIAPSG
jgi:4-amino-4-deoxy-L-arabinose transferase-like glycosyltransferase